MKERGAVALMTKTYSELSQMVVNGRVTGVRILLAV